MRFSRVAEMPLADIETNIRFISRQGVQQGKVPFEKFAGMPPGANRLDQGMDRFFGVEVIPLVGGHACDLWGVDFEIGKQSNTEIFH